jgi:hypothetical protein
MDSNHDKVIQSLFQEFIQLLHLTIFNVLLVKWLDRINSIIGG